MIVPASATIYPHVVQCDKAVTIAAGLPVRRRRVVVDGLAEHDASDPRLRRIHGDELVLECEKGDVMGDGRTKVLIIGGGFGGLFCARRLGPVAVVVTLLGRA